MKEIIYESCPPFWVCITKISNTQVDEAKDIDFVILIYHLIEYINNYSTTSGSLWQYHRDEPNDDIKKSESHIFKAKITGKAGNHGITNAEIVLPLNT